MKYFCGIDNGISGAITILSDSGKVLHHDNTPVIKCLNYTKSKAFIHRIDFQRMNEAFLKVESIDFCLIERPMITPYRFRASISAIRSIEATMIVLEALQIPYQFIDSKEWQKALLPLGLIQAELKIAANDVGRRLFPTLTIVNADSLLIAEYCRRTKR